MKVSAPTLDYVFQGTGLSTFTEGREVMGQVDLAVLDVANHFGARYTMESCRKRCIGGKRPSLGDAQPAARRKPVGWSRAKRIARSCVCASKIGADRRGGGASHFPVLWFACCQACEHGCKACSVKMSL